MVKAAKVLSSDFIIFRELCETDKTTKELEKKLLKVEKEG